MRPETYLIVGASLTGATAAAALRKEGFDGRVVLIGDESAPPYERPELSKKYLRGEAGVELAVHAPDFYREAGIDLLTGRRADRIDSTRRVVFVGDEAIAFDRLLLATGAAPRRPEVPGRDLEGILTLRTIDDADRIRQRALVADRIVVAGGGWIGSEVAASLRQLGREVTLVLPTETPMERVLGSEVGAVYRSAHQENGVRLVTRTRVVRFEGRTRVAAVITDDGQRLAADLVVLGLGATPRTGLAEAAGIPVHDGILVDERLETTVPGVFAAGDVAAAWHPRYGRRLRVEHWDNAKGEGATAAENMLGRARPYDRVPYFYSDQYDLGMEYRGFAATWDEVVFRGDPGSREFIAFWLQDRRVTAALNMNVWDATPALQQLVGSAAAVDRDQLRDAGRPLEELAAAA